MAGLTTTSSPVDWDETVVHASKWWGIACDMSLNWLFAGLPGQLIGLFCIFQYHLQQLPAVRALSMRLGMKPNQTLREFGLMVWILQVWYRGPDQDSSTWLKALGPCHSTIVLVLFDRLALGSLFTRCTCDRSIEDDDPRNDVYSPEKAADAAASKYTMLSLPLRRVIPLFVVQLGLFSFYINALSTNSNMINENKQQLGKWLIGVLIALFAAEQQLGDSYDLAFWELLFDKKREQIKTQRHDFIQGWFRISFKREWQIRHAMDWIVNFLVRLTIFYTFPMVLWVEGSMEFVKDCTAIFFLTTLDDLDSSAVLSISQLTAKLKFDMFYEHVLASGWQEGEPEPEAPLALASDEAVEVVHGTDTIYARYTNMFGGMMVRQLFRDHVADDALASVSHKLNHGSMDGKLRKIHDLAAKIPTGSQGMPQQRAAGNYYGPAAPLLDP